MVKSMIFMVLLGGKLLSGTALAQELVLESVPPMVVKTVPESGVDDVESGATEIRVKFSKTMQEGTWSWSTVSKESFPETTGKAKYEEDRRTCVLPVKLQPGKTYAIWVNSQRFHNFKDADGQPALPYLLVFRTKG